MNDEPEVQIVGAIDLGVVVSADVVIAAEELPIAFPGRSVVGVVTGPRVEGVFRYPDNTLFFTELSRSR